MWTYEHEVEGKVDLEKLWELYSDVSQWSKWDPSIEKVEMFGPFATGTKCTHHMTGMPPIEVTLTEVTPYKSFTDEAVMANWGITLQFGHTIEEKGEGVFVIRHTVVIMGENAQAMGEKMGPGITGDIPSCMKTLLELAKS